LTRFTRRALAQQALSTPSCDSTPRTTSTSCWKAGLRERCSWASSRSCTTDSATSPGAPRKAALSRLTDESLKRKNNEQAAADCLFYFADLFPDPDLDCDEYPFESTWQGAHTSGSSQRYSVQPLPVSENRSAGNALGQWYFNDRILEGDRFWVQIDP
jgi:Deoxyribonuclease NucA/NucB